MKFSPMPSLVTRTLPIVGACLIATAGCGKDAPPAADAGAVQQAPSPAPQADAAEVAKPGTETPEAPDATPPAEPPQVARSCDDPAVTTALAKLRPDFAVLNDGDEFRLCGGIGGDARACVVYTPNEKPEERKDGALFGRAYLALGEDDLDHIPNFPASFDDGFRREDARPLTKICISPTDGCKDLFVGRATGGHFNADRTRAVLTTMGEDEARVVRVYNLETLEQIYEVPLPGTSFIDCTFADFVGSSLVIGTGPCTTTDGASAWLVDAETGEKRGDLGGETPLTLRDGQYVQVDGDQWAFRDAAGERVLFVNTATAETVATVATNSKATSYGRDSAFVKSNGAGRVLIAETSPTMGALLVVDGKTHSLVANEAPKPCE